MRRRTLLGAAAASMASLSGCLGATEYTVTDVRVGQSSAPVGLDGTVEEIFVSVTGGHAPVEEITEVDR